MPESVTPRRSPYSRLLDKATRILAMRDHSEQELRRKLSAQPTFPGKPKAEEDPFTPEDIDKVIAWCYEHRWLDDAHFASRFIASRG
ncbi:regulatory protein RecX, partial [Buttiauxella brennerae]